MKLLFKKLFRKLLYPFRKIEDNFLSSEVIYLVIPFEEDKIIDLDRIVIYSDYKDAEKEVEYLKNFYPHTIISVENLNFKYIEPNDE
jgi:hypothetical protein